MDASLPPGVRLKAYPLRALLVSEGGTVVPVAPLGSETSDPRSQITPMAYSRSTPKGVGFGTARPCGPLPREYVSTPIGYEGSDYAKGVLSEYAVRRTPFGHARSTPRIRNLGYEE